jgi:hypothetical protein
VFTEAQRRPGVPNPLADILQSTGWVCQDSVRGVRLPVKVKAEVEHPGFPTLREALDQSLRQGGLARLTGPRTVCASPSVTGRPSSRGGLHCTGAASDSRR